MGAKQVQKRLRGINAAYAAIPGERTDSAKRKAMWQTLGAVIDHLKAQPDWHAADTTLLTKLAHGLINTENGRKVSWMVGEGGHRLKGQLINVTILRARAAADMQRHMDRGFSRQRAAKKVCEKISKGSSHFNGTKREGKTVARWRDDLRSSPPKSLGRKVYEAELKK